MTTKELDIKLARDVAKIRIANAVAAASKHPSTSAATRATVNTTLSSETIRAMDDIDAGHEEDLIAELNTILSDEGSMQSIRTVITETYIKLVQTKLGIHKKARLESKKRCAKFSAADRKKVIQSDTTELSKAATIIKIAYESKAKEAVINAAAAETYAYNSQEMIKAITRFLGAEVLGKDPINFNTELITFADGVQSAIEHLEKVQYYGTWIYERFQPIGIIKVTWSTGSGSDQDLDPATDSGERNLND